MHKFDKMFIDNLAALNLEDEWLALFAFYQSCFSAD